MYAGNRETLLEENTEYASYVSVKYDYSKTETEQKKRALREGCGLWTPATAGTCGTTKSIGNNYLYSPFMKKPNSGGATDPHATLDTAWDHGGSEKSFQTDGRRLEGETDEIKSRFLR